MVKPVNALGVECWRAFVVVNSILYKPKSIFKETVISAVETANPPAYHIDIQRNTHSCNQCKGNTDNTQSNRHRFS